MDNLSSYPTKPIFFDNDHSREKNTHTEDEPQKTKTDTLIKANDARDEWSSKTEEESERRKRLEEAARYGSRSGRVLR